MTETFSSPVEETPDERDLDGVEESFESPRERRGGYRKRGGARKVSPKIDGANEKVEKGLIVSTSRRTFDVRTEAGSVLSCSLKGRLQGMQRPVVGDHVFVQVIDQEEGVLQEICPRKNTLTRVAEDDGGKSRTIAANVDRLVAILSVKPFPPRWALADRLLALCEREDIQGLIVLNKMDLLSKDSQQYLQLEEEAQVYQKLDIPVLFTSAVSGDGIGELKEAMKGKVNIFSGHSGVGKSSLLNTIFPGWNLAVKEVNPHTSKGRHTTTSARLLRLSLGGEKAEDVSYVIDTPGFREFGLGHVDAAELGRYFKEFRPIIGNCRFSDCLHTQEPGCALKIALENEKISNLRYQNYLQILQGLVDKD